MRSGARWLAAGVGFAVTPAETTFSAACNMNLQQSAVLRAIFKGRELILGSKPEERPCPLGMVAQAKAWGLGRPGRIPRSRDHLRWGDAAMACQPVVSGTAPDEFEAFHAAKLCEACVDIAR